jgi:methyl-accepting chemotaxis protein
MPKMNWLKNVSLAPKLLASLALMVALSAVLVVMALTSFAAVYSSVQSLKQANTRNQHSSRATSNMIAYIRNIEFLPLELSEQERAGYEKGAVDEKAEFTGHLDALDKLVIVEDGRRNLAAIRAILARYEPQARNVTEQARKADYDGSTKTALAASTMATEMRHELNAIDERNEKFVAKSVGEVEATYQGALWTLTLVAAIGGLLGVGLAASLIVFGVTRPLRNMTGAMLKVAAGDDQTVIPSLGQKDEVGRLAGALEAFKLNLIESKRLVVEQEAERSAKERRAAVLDSLIKGFDTTIGNIVGTVSASATELEAAANTLTKTAETTQELSATVAAASEEASANVNSVASATEEMASSVNEIARQVHESSKIAGEAVKQAEKTDARIAELSQAATRIGDVVKLITSVAEQTNLLALNATIEAARAGEAGRGFAVVASEVKALAAQTAKATEEIGTQIAGIQAATQDSVGAIKEISGTIGRISEIAATIAAAVEEQGAATQEISRNVQQAAQGTAQVASNITDVNRGAGETGAASAQVLSSAQSLSKESNHLKLEVDKFLHTVRAA